MMYGTGDYPLGFHAGAAGRIVALVEAEHWERETGYRAWLDGADRPEDQLWEWDFLLLGGEVADELLLEQHPYPGWCP